MSSETLTWDSEADWDDAQSEDNVKHASGSVEVSGLPDGVVAEYPMVNDNGDTSVVEDFAGSYDGDVTGASYNSSGGPHGQGSYTFDSDSDRIEYPDGAAIGGTSERTLLAWFNVDDTGDRQMIYGYGNDTEYEAFELEVNYPYNPEGNSDNQAENTVGVHTWSASVTGPNGLIEDYSAWHMFAATHEGGGSMDGVSLYYDGDSISTSVNDSGSLDTGTANFASGSSVAHGDNTTNVVSGDVAYPVILDRELSASEIQSIYDNFKDGTRDGTLTTAKKVS